MRTMAALVAGLVLAVAGSGCSQPSGAAAAAEAMGATNLNSIQFSGSGTNNAFGQAYSPGGPWPRFEVKNYIAAVDYQTPAMRLEMLRAQGEHPPRGGGAQPFAIDQRTIQVVSGKSAWSEGGAQPAPNPGAVTDRLRQIWLTPHGVIKAALAGGTPPTGNVFTFKAEDRDVKVTLNQENLVERVEYLTTNSVVGDVPVEIDVLRLRTVRRHPVSAAHRRETGRLPHARHHDRRRAAQCRRLVAGAAKRGVCAGPARSADGND